jgi:hypothetical protein
MATYSVNISLKDSAGSFVANSNAIVIFANCGYNSMDNTNTVIASDSSQTLSSEENLAKLIFAFSSETAEITSTFYEYGFDSTTPDEDITDTVDELQALDISTLPGYTEDMGNISNFKKFVVYSNLAFGYFINDGDSVAFEVTIGGVTPTAPTVTYEAGSEYNVTPASPITVSGDVNLVVTLNDGYKWDDVAQKITIDGNEITGTVSEKTCTFALTTTNVGTGGAITWGLHFSVVQPPSEERVDFFTIYEPTDANMKKINDAIFINAADGTTINVLHYFSSYKKFYCKIPVDGYKQLKGGAYNFGEQAPYVKEHTIVVDCGSVEITEQYHSLLDYSPFSRLTIYLPFIGFQDLDDKLVVGHTLKVQYVVDVLSGRCLAQLYIDSTDLQSCFAEYGGTIAADEIFGSDNGYDYYGAYELMTTLQLGELSCYVLIHTKIPLEGDIVNYKGLPTNEIVKVGDVTGFIKYSSIHVDGMTATDIEKDEIESLLMSGIFV